MPSDVPASYFIDGRPRHGGHREEADLVLGRQLQGLHELPQDARGSIADQDAQPDEAVPDARTPASARSTPRRTATAQGYTELTPTEFYKLILAADMGVNYYARENNPRLNIVLTHRGTKET